MSELPPLGTEVTDSAPNANYDGKQSVLRAPASKTGTKPVKRVKPPAKPATMPAKGVIKDSLTQMYAFAGMGVRMWSEPVSDSILNNAETCAESLEELARTNESVRRVLLSLTKSSAWGGVLIAHAPIAMAVYAELQKPRVEITQESTDTPDAEPSEHVNNADAFGRM